jgi:hypothetical protein
MSVSCFVTIVDQETENESTRSFASVPRRGDEVRMAGRRYFVEQVVWNTDFDVVEIYVVGIGK